MESIKRILGNVNYIKYRFIKDMTFLADEYEGVNIVGTEDDLNVGLSIDIDKVGSLTARTKTDREKASKVFGDIIEFLDFMIHYSGSRSQTIVLKKKGYDKIKDAVKSEMSDLFDEGRVEVEDGKLIFEQIGYTITVIREE